MKETITCYECGNPIHENEARYLRDIPYCEDCYSRETVICDSCGERIPRIESESDGNITLCRGCYDDDYIVCRSCGEFVRNDDAVYNEDNDYYYCEAC